MIKPKQSKTKQNKQTKKKPNNKNRNHKIKYTDGKETYMLHYIICYKGNTNQNNNKVPIRTYHYGQNMEH